MLTRSSRHLVKILIRGHRGTGKSTLWRMLKGAYSPHLANPLPEKDGIYALWQRTLSKSSLGRSPQLSSASKGPQMAEPYVRTRQIQVSNVCWKYKGNIGRMLLPQDLLLLLAPTSAL